MPDNAFGQGRAISEARQAVNISVGVMVYSERTNFEHSTIKPTQYAYLLLIINARGEARQR